MIAETVQSLSSDNNAGIGGLYIVVLWQPEPSDEMRMPDLEAV